MRTIDSAMIFLLLSVATLNLLYSCSNSTTSPTTSSEGGDWEPLTVPHATALSAEPTSGHNLVGINLGNTLDAIPTEGSWTNGVLAQKYYFTNYVTCGFNTVRIPVTWDTHLETSSPFTVDPVWMARVQQVVGWATSAGLVAVVNAHHENWMYTTPYTPGTAQAARFEALWNQIALTFKNTSPSAVIFEILNEPQGAMTDTDLNALNQDILNIIRSTGSNNTVRRVIIGGNNFNSFNTLQNLSLPLTGGVVDPNLIANFHYYNPWTLAGLAQGTWGTASDKSQLLGDLQTVQAWSTAHNNIPIFMGEYGCIRNYTPSGGSSLTTDPNSRLLWYQTICQDARSLGFSYTAWDDSGDFGIYNRAGQTFEKGLLSAIFGP